MNFPFYIAKRYLKAKSSQNAVNIINYITFFVVVVGSASLFIVLSAFSGLKNLGLQFSELTDPELKVIPVSGKFFEFSEEQRQALDSMKGILAFSEELEERVYLSHENKSQIAYIKGVSPSYTEVIPIEEGLYFGSWNLNDQGVIGIGLANLLSVTVDNYTDPIRLLLPKPLEGSGFNPTSLPYYESFLSISGVYAVELDLDNKYLFSSIDFARALLRKSPSEISGINLKIEDTYKEDLIISINELFAPSAEVKTREQLNASLYKMLNTENAATYLIFTLVLIIALFNVVGATLMVILDKRAHLKTLFAMGLELPQLRRIYFFQGFLLSALGGLIGVMLASLVIGAQLLFGFVKIGMELSYPVAFSLENFILVLGTIFVLGALAAYIASRKINRELLA